MCFDSTALYLGAPSLADCCCKHLSFRCQGTAVLPDADKSRKNWNGLLLLFQARIHMEIRAAVSLTTRFYQLRFFFVTMINEVLSLTHSTPGAIGTFPSIFNSTFVLELISHSSFFLPFFLSGFYHPVLSPSTVSVT